MTFKELKKIDYEGAFKDWKSIKFAKENGEIPEKFHTYFEDFCTCGSENIIKSGLSIMTCCNPKCSVKQGFAIAEMFTRFGIKGLQEATCSRIYRELKEENARLIERGEQRILLTDSYVSVLIVPWEKYPYSVKSTAKGVEFYQACCTVRSKTMTFPQIIKSLAVPSLGAEAEILFQGFTNSDQIFDAIEKCGSMQAFCVSRGFYSEMLSFNLRQHMIDIVTAGKLLTKQIRPEGSIKINICMTGSIIFKNVKTTKEKYLQECNKLCLVDGVQLLEITMNAAVESNPFVLYSRASGDRKFRVGSARGEITDIFGTHPVLMHVDTFYNFLERVIDKWNKEKSLMTKENLSTMLRKNFQHSMAITLSQ